MKKCLFFFLALVMAIVLATMTETTVVDDVQDQTVSNYTREVQESPEISPEWTALELNKTYASQSQNP